MVATPLLLKMLVGTPDPSIEMTIGKGPAPLGVVIVELKVMEVDALGHDHRELAAREGGGLGGRRRTLRLPIPNTG